MSHQGKKIFVFLATGDQGKSAIKYLKEDGFEVYGLTRDPTSEKAKAIEKLGAHLVKGDMADVDSYAHALEGMDGAFINADFWGPYYSSGLNADFAAKTEGAQSKAAVDAAIKAKIPHIVYSTLGDHTEDGSIHKGAKYPHHDSKAEVSKYIRKIGAPATHLHTSHYISNCVKFKTLAQKEDGSWLLSYPCPDDCPLPSFAVEQTGLWVAAAFKDPKTWINKDLHAASDLSTYKEHAAKLSKATGIPIDTLHLTKEQFESQQLKDQVTEELWVQYKQFYEGHMPRDIEQSKRVVPEQWDVEAWAKQSPELEDLMHWRK